MCINGYGMAKMKTNPSGEHLVGEQHSMRIDVHNICCEHLLSDFITRTNLTAFFAENLTKIV